MKKYTANQYFNLSEGLHIADESGSTVITIKGESTNEVAAIANKILPVLNYEFKMKTALLADNQANWDMGLITPQERQDKINEIMAAEY